MNVIVDEELLERALRVTGERTYSGAINRGLKELVRQADLNALFELQGTDWWEGDLGVMRGDQPYRAPAEIDMARLRANARKIKAGVLTDIQNARSETRGSMIADRAMSEAELKKHTKPGKQTSRKRRS